MTFSRNKVLNQRRKVLITFELLEKNNEDFSQDQKKRMSELCDLQTAETIKSQAYYRPCLFA